MAFYNNYQQYYPPYMQNQQMPTMQMQAPNTAQQQVTNLVWVQGENSAKSYPVAAGQSILLMDSENSSMYIKSTDQSGMPLPLRIFDYKERTQERAEQVKTVAQPTIDYVSRNEFENFKHDIETALKTQTTTRPITTTKKTTKED